MGCTNAWYRMPSTPKTKYYDAKHKAVEIQPNSSNIAVSQPSRSLIGNSSVLSNPIGLQLYKLALLSPMHYIYEAFHVSLFILINQLRFLLRFNPLVRHPDTTRKTKKLKIHWTPITSKLSPIPCQMERISWFQRFVMLVIVRNLRFWFPISPQSDLKREYNWEAETV